MRERRRERDIPGVDEGPEMRNVKLDRPPPRDLTIMNPMMGSGLMLSSIDRHRAAVAHKRESA